MSSSCGKCLVFQRRILSLNQKNNIMAQELVKRRMEIAELQKTIDFQEQHNFNLRLNRNKIVNIIPELDSSCKFAIEKLKEFCETHAKILNLKERLSAAIIGTENNNNEKIKIPLITVTNASTLKNHHNSMENECEDTSRWNQSLDTIKEEYEDTSKWYQSSDTIEWEVSNKLEGNSSRTKTKNVPVLERSSTSSKSVLSSTFEKTNLSVLKREKPCCTSTPINSREVKFETTEKINLTDVQNTFSEVEEEPKSLFMSSPKNLKEMKSQTTDNINLSGVQNTLSVVEEQQKAMHVSAPKESVKKKIDSRPSERRSLTENSSLSEIGEQKKVSLGITSQITEVCRRRLSQVSRLASPTRVSFSSSSINSVSLERPRRAAAPSSLKEPDLVRKMRRPK